MRYRILNALGAPAFLPLVFLLSGLLWAALLVKVGPELLSVVLTGELTSATSARTEGRSE